MVHVLVDLVWLKHMAFSSWNNCAVGSGLQMNLRIMEHVDNRKSVAFWDVAD
jgi:hypothetical protein